MMKFVRCINALLLLLLIACGRVENGPSAILIAHAGGAVDGVVMTNSREALVTARDNGFKFIEFDLIFTADSVLVATHSWEEYNAGNGHEKRGGTAPTLAEFLSQPLPGGHTPLTAKDINDFFVAHDSLFLVTDKVSDARVLGDYFPELKNRMMVEAFSYKDYCELLRQGYAYVTYSCLAEDVDVAPVKHLLFHWLFSGEKIECVALHTSAFEYGYLKILRALANFKIALYTVNNLSEIPENATDDIIYLYTDSLLPTSTQGAER